MTFYLVEISDGDDKIKGKAMYEYADRTEALSQFHKKLGIAMGSELYTREQILVINSANGIEASDLFVREVEPEPTPEPTEEVTEE